MPEFTYDNAFFLGLHLVFLVIFVGGDLKDIFALNLIFLTF